MFVCYLDDSDAEQSSVMTLAGYVSTLDQWEKFERRADRYLNAYGVPILHAKEFHDTKGVHKGWSQVKKNAFIDGLYNIAADTVMFGLSRSAQKKTFRDVKAATNINPHMSAYGYAFGTIVHAIARGSSVSEQVQKEGLSFVVESGHNNNAEVEKFFHKVKNQEIYKGILRSFSFSGKAESRAIQLADFYAFYSRRYAAKLDGVARDVSLAPEKNYGRFVHRFLHHGFTISNPYAKKHDHWSDGDYAPGKDALA